MSNKVGGDPVSMTLGQTSSVTKTMTAEDVETFARLVGDFNPVHMDEEFAKQTRFGRRVAHSPLNAALFSAVIGMGFPGVLPIFLGQTIRYKAPVFFGDTLTATATVTKVREDKPVVTLEAVVTNQDGTVVIDGEIVLYVDKLSQEN